MASSSADLKLAQHLAAPFTPPGRQSRPMSCRLLPDGGMVVISAEGRKLWFTFEEVNQARRALGLRQVPQPPSPCLPKEEQSQSSVSSSPPATTREGKSEMIVLPPELKHLEKKINDKTGRH